MHNCPWSKTSEIHKSKLRNASYIGEILAPVYKARGIRQTGRRLWAKFHPRCLEIFHRSNGRRTTTTTQTFPLSLSLSLSRGDKLASLRLIERNLSFNQRRISCRDWHPVSATFSFYDFVRFFTAPRYILRERRRRIIRRSNENPTF